MPCSHLVAWEEYSRLAGTLLEERLGEARRQKEDVVTSRHHPAQREGGRSGIAAAAPGGVWRVSVQQGGLDDDLDAAEQRHLEQRQLQARRARIAGVSARDPSTIDLIEPKAVEVGLRGSAIGRGRWGRGGKRGRGWVGAACSKAACNKVRAARYVQQGT